jgi:hypothetical protein
MDFDAFTLDFRLRACLALSAFPEPRLRQRGMNLAIVPVGLAPPFFGWWFASARIRRCLFFQVRLSPDYRIGVEVLDRRENALEGGAVDIQGREKKSADNGSDDEPDRSEKK